MSSESVAATYQRVMARTGELADLESAGALLGWDQETFMPSGGVIGRASVSATLAGLAHEKLSDAGLGDDLSFLAESNDELDEEARAQLQELTRLRDRAVKIPAALVRTLAETQSVATSKWAEARAAKDYPSFAPYLEKIFALKKEEAEAIGFEEEPYEALLDEYEPGAKVADIARRLAEVRDFLVPLVARIKESGVEPDAGLLAGPYDAAAQEVFGKEVVTAMGFDMKSGRLDVSEHPFTSGIHLGDVRLTTRYKNDLSVGLFGTMHEGGHGIYEQNLPEDQRRTPLGASTSLGIHESQSRLWENQVGRGRPFWVHWYPRLAQLFPAQVGTASVGDFYRAINAVKPSFIRIEADEVTYNLHIALRFEIERGLMSGVLSVEDLPEIWNTKFKEYLGLVPPSPDLGVMQDIHWAFGLIGYFPTYTLGNVYSAQLYEAAARDIPGLEEGIAKGDLLPLKDWMVNNVHCWGRRYNADKLIEVATGQPATVEPFTRYLSTKYGELYGLS